MGYLLQQKFSAFALGVGTSAALYVTTKRQLARVTAETASSLPAAPPPPPPLQQQKPAALWGPAVRARLVRKWNESVDAVFKPVVAALTSRDL